MVFFWGAAADVAVKRERLRAAEAALMDFSLNMLDDDEDTMQIEAIDTFIPAFPSPNSGWFSYWNSKEEQDQYTIHSIRVTNQALLQREQDNAKTSTSKSATEDHPLVLLHGYANGGAYFYRNFAGLHRYFSKIHSLDLLGWGLSSRPDFANHNRHHVATTKANNKENNQTIEAAEDFFVESLESWRKAQKIDSMILAGHSMGGYLSVAYTERYPQHVHRLVLLSPVGVNPSTPDAQQKLKSRYLTTMTSRFFYALYGQAFQYWTPCDLLRALPNGRDRVDQYVNRRLPALHNTEKETLAEYLFVNNVLPGSGEYCLSKLLHPNALAHRPLHDRIPHLLSTSCVFLYGERDWMDVNGGLGVAQQCPAAVSVYQVQNAGHLLMLENYNEFNNGLVVAAGRGHLLDEQQPVPRRL